MAHVTIDPLRCEGSGHCALVCPGEVFALRPPEPDLPFRVRLRVSFHSGRQARVVDAAACTACMRCVGVCGGQAITVQPEGCGPRDSVAPGATGVAAAAS